MKKLNYLIKGIRLSKKNLLLICAVTFLCAVMFCVYCGNMYSSRQKKVETIKEQVGDYHVRLESTPQVISYIEKNVDVDDMYVTKELGMGVDDVRYFFVEATNEWIDKSEYSLLKGSLPDNDNEVVLEKWYMLSLGFKDEEMIGAQVDIPNYDTGKFERKVVSGLIVNMQDLTTDGTVVCGMKINTKEPTFGTIFLKIKDMEKIYDVIREIMTACSITDDTYVIPNYELLEEYGITEYGDYEFQRQRILTFVSVFAVACVVLITLLNVLKIFVDDIRYELRVFYCLGIDRFTLAGYVTSYMFVLLTIGAYAGIVAGYFGVAQLCKALEQEVVFYWGKYALIALVVIFCISFITGLAVLTILEKSNAVAVNDENDFLFRIISGNLKTLFENPHIPGMKMIARNLVKNLPRKIITILIGAVSVVMLMLLFVQAKEQMRYPDDNYEYTYRIELEYDSGIRNGDQLTEAYLQIRDILSDTPSSMYIYEWFRFYPKVKKDELSEEYKKLLAEKFKYYKDLNNDYIDYVEVSAYILGYSKEMLQELCEKYDVSVPKGNQMLVLNKSVNRNNRGSKDVHIKKGTKFLVETFATEYDEINEFRFIVDELVVTDSVGDLPVYPNFYGNYLTFIVEEDYFNKYFGDFNIPEMIYIKDAPPEAIEKISALCRGSTYIRMINQEDEIKAVKMEYYNRIVGYSIIFILAFVFALINGVLMLKLDLGLRRKEMDTYNILGICKHKVRNMLIAEYVIVDIIGLGVGILAAKIVIEKLIQAGYVCDLTLTMEKVAIIAVAVVLLLVSKMRCICKFMKS